MSAPNAHDVLRKLALLEAVGPDNPPEEILDELDRDLRNLQPGALDYALGDIPEDSVEENDTPLTLAASALGQPDAIDDELSPDLSVATLTRGAAARVWENWSKTYLARDLNFRSPRTAAELVRAVQEVVDASGTVKAIGAGYSCSSAAQPYKAGTVINTQDHLKRILPVIGLKDPQQAARLVRVEAGIRLDQLARELAKLELALPNLGGFDKQTLAGAISTGTHGTGLDQSTFADAVVSVDVVLVDSNGRAQLHRFEPTDGVTDPASYAQAKEFLHQNDDEFYGMVVSCGMTGIVYSYTLRVVELYFVRETNESFVFPDDFLGVMRRVKANENISISIHPNATLEGGKYRGLLNRFERLSKAQVNTINAGLWNNPPPRPTERNFLDYLEGLVGTKFIGWFMANNKKFVRGQIDKYLKESAGRSFTSVYYRVYPRPTGDRFVAVFNELSVPLDQLERCTQQVLDHVRRNWDANDLLYQVPFALRFVGKSKHFLSMHYARDSATIEAFCLLGSRRPSATLTALERLLPQARPHWGQLHALLTPVSDQYPSSWGLWLKQYKRANVSGVFNSPMTTALGITQPRPRPATDTQLRSVAQGVSTALNNEAIEGDIDEHYPGLAELLSDEDVRADLLPHLRAGQSRQLSTRRDTFQNWLGEGGISVADIIDDADSLDDLRGRLSSTLNPVRVCGKRHSDNLVARPDPGSLVVDLSNWRIKRSAGIVSETLCQRLDASKIVSVPYEKHEAQGKRYVRMFAWETLQDIADRGAQPSNGDPLERFALFNTGSFTHQTLAGPLSVGTHGSGAGLGAMCDQVAAIDILGLDGIVRRVSKMDTNFPLTEVIIPDGRGRYTPLPSSADFNASVVNLGTLGVVLAYWVEVDQFYWLKQLVETRLLEDALNWVEQDLNDPNSKWRHVELLLMPERAPDEYKCALIRREKCGENSGQKGPPQLPPIVQRMRCNPEATRANATTLSRVKLARQTMYKEALEFQMKGNGDAGPWSQVLVRNTGVPAHGFEIAVGEFNRSRQQT